VTGIFLLLGTIFLHDVSSIATGNLCRLPRSWGGMFRKVLLRVAGWCFYEDYAKDNDFTQDPMDQPVFTAFHLRNSGDCTISNGFKAYEPLPPLDTTLSMLEKYPIETCMG